MARRTRAAMEETRASLLATARKAFAETGYAEASMDELTAQAGLTRGALYHHFGDKKGLLAAVVAQIDGEMDERLGGDFRQGDKPMAGTERALQRLPAHGPGTGDPAHRAA